MKFHAQRRVHLVSFNWVVRIFSIKYVDLSKPKSRAPDYYKLTWIEPMIQSKTCRWHITSRPFAWWDLHHERLHCKASDITLLLLFFNMMNNCNPFYYINNVIATACQYVRCEITRLVWLKIKVMIEKMKDGRNKELKKPTCWTGSQRGLGCGMAYITSNRPCQLTWLSLSYVTLRLWINFF